MDEKMISIVVPMYFEERVVNECYKRLTEAALNCGLSYELIFINDGSEDNTLVMLQKLAQKDKHVKVISFSRNFGHQIAVTAGIDRAKGDAIIIIDADLQDPPELIPEMIKLWRKGYEIVYGKRKKREGETWFKLITAKTFYRVLSGLSNIKIPVDTGDFRLIDKKVAAVLRRMPEQNRFLRGMYGWIGFRQIALEYNRKERYAGETKYPLKKMLNFALDGIISFSSKPVKLIEGTGLSIIFISLIIFIYLLLSNIIGFTKGNSMVILVLSVVAFCGGLQLFSLGVMGEYITRIYDESKKRPLYIVAEEFNTDINLEVPLKIVSRGSAVKFSEINENKRIINSE